jgi:hypothetical protein
MGRNILFYSNRCKLCESFFVELAQTKFKNDFQYICVDPGPNNQRPRLPGFLKKVPTILIDGNSNEPMEGAEAMNWLWVAKMQSGDSGGSTLPNNPAASDGGANDGGMGLSFWNPLEMGGGSDTYSFIDEDATVEGNGGYSISQNYEYIGGGPGPMGMGMGGGGGGSQRSAAPPQVKKSAKEQHFDSEMERYQQMRNMGIPQPPNRR